MTPGSGVRAALRLHKSDHPEDTLVLGSAGPIVGEDFLVAKMGVDLDVGIVDTASSIYDGLAKAERYYARTREPVRVVHIIEREVVRVGVKP